MKLIKELQEISNVYLTARKKFLKDVAELYTKHKSTVLSGNDNIIGRIGEFVAYQHLCKVGFKPLKPANLKSNPVFDFVCNKTKYKITVKTITSENEKGRTTRIKGKWDLFILVEINEDQKVSRIGQLEWKDFLASREKYPNRSGQPYASRSMLNDKGLIGEFGTLANEEFIKKYL